MEIVVLDATALIQDFRLRSAPTQVLLYMASSGTMRVVAPESVVREVVGRFRAEVSDATEKLRPIESRLARLGVRLEYDPPNIDEVTESFEAELRERLGSRHVVVADPPEIDLLDLVSAAVARKRPFSDAGEGFRDAIVWEHVCGEASSHLVARVTLVSNDHRAFRDDPAASELAAQLQDDLDARGVSRSSVRLCRSIAELIAAAGIDDPTVTAEVAQLVEVEREQIRENVAIALKDASVVPSGAGRVEVEQGFPPPYLVLHRVVASEDTPGLDLVELEAEGDVDVYVESYSPEDGLEWIDTTMTLNYVVTATYDRELKTLDNFTVPLVEIDLREALRSEYGLRGRSGI